MKTYIRQYWKFILGVILIILFFIFRITLVFIGGPHDLWTELISTVSFVVGLISGCLVCSKPKDQKAQESLSIPLDVEYHELLELQNDEYNYGHNVEHKVDKYVE